MGKTRDVPVCGSVSVPRTHLHCHSHWTSAWTGEPLRSPPLPRARCACLSSVTAFHWPAGGRSANDTVVLEHNYTKRAASTPRQSERSLCVTFPQGRKQETTLEPLTLWEGREAWHSVHLQLRVQRELHGGPDSISESGTPQHGG